MDIKNKLHKLKTVLRKYPGAVVAFSGGVDSTLLLKVAADVLKGKVIAVTAVSPLYPQGEIANARKITRQLGIEHRIIKSHELTNPRFIKNTRNRCFYCKLELFQKLNAIAERSGYPVLEASNKSDLQDYRPGLRAARKLGIESPLIAAALEKDEIRKLARALKLSNWNKPSMACLASRIPYGHHVLRRSLRRIDRAELYLRKIGIHQVRVRDYYPLARIEVFEREFAKVLGMRSHIVKHLRRLGYKYIALDLEGYHTGSLNR